LRKVKIITSANEEMEVIGHHHVFTNGDTKLVSSSAHIALERAVRCVQVFNLLPMYCANR